MKTSDLIKGLIESLISHGDLETNIKDISWYCPCENGTFQRVILNSEDDLDVENKESN